MRHIFANLDTFRLRCVPAACTLVHIGPMMDCSPPPALTITAERCDMAKRSLLDSAHAGKPQEPRQKFSALDMALMPDYRREFYRTLYNNCIANGRPVSYTIPSEGDVQLAWGEWHAVTSQSGGDQRVYFIQRGIAGPIKIGISASIKKRMSSMQTACADRLVLLAVCRGGRALESEYHKQFSSYRLEGEWFTEAAAILQEIDRIRSMPRAWR